MVFTNSIVTLEFRRHMKVSLDSKAELYLKTKGIDTVTLFLRRTGGG